MSDAKPAPPKTKKAHLPPAAVVRVRSAVVTGKVKPILPGLHVLFRTAALSAVPEKARAKGAELTSAPPPPPEPPLFQLGRVDAAGWLVPATDPLEGAAKTKGKGTDAIKLLRPLSCQTGVYDFFFVSHPDPAVARRVLANVNHHEGKYEKPDGTFLEPRELQLVQVKDDEHVLEVPESPDVLLPAIGSKVYERWLLFRDLPHRHCEAVMKQIRKLQLHLAALRYPVGEPYVPKDGDDGNLGRFDACTWNGVIAFERDYAGAHDAAKHRQSATRPFVASALPDAAVTTGTPTMDPKGPYAALLAGGKQAAEDVIKQFAKDAESDRGKKEGSLDGAPAPPPADGIVDHVAAEAIRKCLDLGLRKPDPILVPTQSGKVEGFSSWATWLRPEARSALDRWRELAELFGAPSIAASHTYRVATTDVKGAGYGRAVLSIHKSGFAIDLFNTHHVKPWSADVCYEKVGDEGNVSWRLYGKAQLAKADIDAAVEKIVKIVAPQHQALVGQGVSAVGADWIRAQLLAPFRPDATSFDEVRWDHAGTELVARLALDQSKSPYPRALEENLRCLFKHTVESFQYVRDHPSYGSDERVFKKDVTAGGGEVFVNLTCLGLLFGLTPIHAFADGWHSTRKQVTVADSRSFGAAVGAIATANDRFDVNILEDRPAGILEVVLAAVKGLKREQLVTVRDGALVRVVADDDEALTALVAGTLRSVLETHTGAAVRTSKGVSSEYADDEGLKAAVGNAALEMLRKNLELRLAAPAKSRGSVADKDLKPALVTIKEKHVAAISQRLEAIESQLEASERGVKRWRVTISRASINVERNGKAPRTAIPIADLEDSVVDAVKAWRKHTDERKLGATPDIRIDDLLYEIEPRGWTKAEPAERNVKLKADGKRLQAIQKLLALPGLASISYIAFVGTLVPPDKKAKKGKGPSVLADHSWDVSVAAGGGDLVAQLETLLTAFYRESDAGRAAKPYVFVRPVFPEPLDFELGDTVEATFPGEPIGMEWWHFQYHPGLAGKLWSSLLNDIGWTETGLGTTAAAYGFSGLGYSDADLAKPAR
jgi:hypothetical protein